MRSFIFLTMLILCVISWNANAAEPASTDSTDTTVEARPEPVKKTAKVVGKRIKERPVLRRILRRRSKVEMPEEESKPMMEPTPAKKKNSERAKKMAEMKKKWEAMTPEQRKKAIEAHNARRAAWAKANPEKSKKMAERRKKWEAMSPEERKKAMEAHKNKHKRHGHHKHHNHKKPTK